jgi:hypothetical protein
VLPTRVVVEQQQQEGEEEKAVAERQRCFAREGEVEIWVLLISRAV